MTKRFGTPCILLYTVAILQSAMYLTSNKRAYIQNVFKSYSDWGKGAPPQTSLLSRQQYRNRCDITKGTIPILQYYLIGTIFNNKPALLLHEFLNDSLLVDELIHDLYIQLKRTQCKRVQFGNYLFIGKKLLKNTNSIT